MAEEGGSGGGGGGEGEGRDEDEAEEERVSLGVYMTNTEIFHIFHIFSLLNFPFFHISLSFHFST